jgi:hypothetical protein
MYVEDDSMKVIKKLFTMFLSLILIVLFIGLALIFTLEELTINSFNENLVKPKLKESIIIIIKDKYPNFNEDKIKELGNEILNDPDVDYITKIYIENIIQSILSNRDIPLEKTKEDIIRIIEKMNLTDSQKNNIINEINNVNSTLIYSDIEFKVKSSMTERNTKIIKIYNFLISDISKICLLILLILIGLIIILLADYFMLNLGLSIITSSSLIFFFMPKYIYLIFEKISILSKEYKINLDLLYKFGYLYYIIGSIFVIIHLIILIIRRRRECLQA